MTTDRIPDAIPEDELRRLCEVAPTRETVWQVPSLQASHYWKGLWAFYTAARTALPAILDERADLRKRLEAAERQRDELHASESRQNGLRMEAEAQLAALRSAPGEVSDEAVEAALNASWKEAINETAQGSCRKHMRAALTAALPFLAAPRAAMPEQRVSEDCLKDTIAAFTDGEEPIDQNTAAETALDLRDVRRWVSALLGHIESVAYRDTAGLRLDKDHPLIFDLRRAWPSQPAPGDVDAAWAEYCRANEGAMGVFKNREGKAFRAGFSAGQSHPSRDVRVEALEEAARVAEGAHRGPVGGSDGDTFVCGSNVDAARAIRALIDNPAAEADGADRKEGDAASNYLSKPAREETRASSDAGRGGVSAGAPVPSGESDADVISGRRRAVYDTQASDILAAIDNILHGAENEFQRRPRDIFVELHCKIHELCDRLVDNEIALARAGIAAELQWRDMKSAPVTPGNWALVFRGKPFVPDVVIRTAEGWETGGRYGCVLDYEPIAWMPLPIPPAPQAQERGE